MEAGFGFVGNGNIEEILRYFYHSNHLGSAVYITNKRGDVTQYIAYIPFGETLAEQHSDWDSPYKFNARELDSETGLYYYGNRYYDPKVSMWLGVDPLAEKFPAISPYVYEANNPVIDKTNGIDGKSVLFTLKQKSAIESIQFYMVTINSGNVPNSISNFSGFFTGPHTVNGDDPEKKDKDDPAKKTDKLDPEKKLPDSVNEKTEVNEEAIKGDTEDIFTAGRENSTESIKKKVEEAVSKEVKPEQTKKTEAKATETPNKQTITKPESPDKVKSGNVPEKTRTQKTTKEKEKIK